VRWGWLLTAAALLGFLIARRRRHGRVVLVAGVLATAGATLVGVGVIELPNIEHLMVDVGSALGRWTYLLVGILAFLETGAFIGLIAPGETTVLVGGLVAGQGEISLLVLIAITWTCAVLGDVTSYTLGRRLGRGWMVRHGPRLKITEERLSQVERFFQRRGGVTILIGRFIGLVRALAPFIAGTSRMPLRVFLPYDVVGAGAWAATFCVLGYVFWQSFDRLTQYVSRGLFAFGTVVAIGVGLYFLVRLRREPELRETVKAWLREREDRPLMRPLVRLSGPLWRRVLSPAAGGVDATARFGWHRLTPGNLGLELTTLLALGAVGAFTFFLLGEVQAEQGDPRIDRFAFDVVDPIEFPMLTDVVSVLTDLGSWPATATVVFATAIWATLRTRYIEAVTLVTGHALTWAAVHVAKDGYDRVRPIGGLVDVSLAAYPSGHAAYSVAFVACATVLVRAGVGWAVRFAALTVAIAIVVVVALSRVYLRVHYLTDVLGGVAMAVAIWAVVGILALFAGRVRHNSVPSP
jgi:membrane protein DedA with SNARE-associated domain/membrane-associated phospholipid phosphatase